MSELACTGDLGSQARVQAALGFWHVPESPALRSLPFRTHMHHGGGFMAADDLVVAERGVLTAPTEAWGLAAPRAGGIKEPAGHRAVGPDAAHAARAPPGVSPRRA